MDESNIDNQNNVGIDESSNSESTPEQSSEQSPEQINKELEQHGKQINPETGEVEDDKKVKLVKAGLNIAKLYIGLKGGNIGKGGPTGGPTGSPTGGPTGTPAPKGYGSGNPSSVNGQSTGMNNKMPGMNNGKNPLNNISQDTIDEGIGKVTSVANKMTGGKLDKVAEELEAESDLVNQTAKTIGDALSLNVKELLNDKEEMKKKAKKVKDDIRKKKIKFVLKYLLPLFGGGLFFVLVLMLIFFPFKGGYLKLTDDGGDYLETQGTQNAWVAIIGADGNKNDDVAKAIINTIPNFGELPLLRKAITVSAIVALQTNPPFVADGAPTSATKEGIVDGIDANGFLRWLIWNINGYDPGQLYIPTIFEKNNNYVQLGSIDECLPGDFGVTGNNFGLYLGNGEFIYFELSAGCLVRGVVGWEAYYKYKPIDEEGSGGGGGSEGGGESANGNLSEVFDIDGFQVAIWKPDNMSSSTGIIWSEPGSGETLSNNANYRAYQSVKQGLVRPANAVIFVSDKYVSCDVIKSKIDKLTSGEDFNYKVDGSEDIMNFSLQGVGSKRYYYGFSAGSYSFKQAASGCIKWNEAILGDGAPNGLTQSEVSNIGISRVLVTQFIENNDTAYNSLFSGVSDYKLVKGEDNNHAKANAYTASNNSSTLSAFGYSVTSMEQPHFGLTWFSGGGSPSGGGGGGGTISPPPDPGPTASVREKVLSYAHYYADDIHLPYQLGWRDSSLFMKKSDNPSYPIYGLDCCNFTDYLYTLATGGGRKYHCGYIHHCEKNGPCYMKNGGIIPGFVRVSLEDALPGDIVNLTWTGHTAIINSISGDSISVCEEGGWGDGGHDYVYNEQRGLYEHVSSPQAGSIHLNLAGANCKASYSYNKGMYILRYTG